MKVTRYEARAQLTVTAGFPDSKRRKGPRPIRDGQRCRQRDFDAPPDGGLPIIELDPDTGNAVDMAHAVNLADCAFRFHGSVSQSGAVPMSRNAT